MEFEKVFDITIEDEVSQNIQTVGDAISHIQAAIENK